MRGREEGEERGQSEPKVSEEELGDMNEEGRREKDGNEERDDYDGDGGAIVSYSVMDLFDALTSSLLLVSVLFWLIYYSGSTNIFDSKLHWHGSLTWSE